MHIGIIMDGNRRWAKQKGLLKVIGHQNGANALEKLLEYAPNKGIKTITVYAFSTENNRRSPKEVEAIFKLMKKISDTRTKDFVKNGIKATLLGDIDSIPEPYKASLKSLEQNTQNGDKFHLQICVNYGGRDEIVRSVKKLIANNQEITEENITKNLDSSLEPELIIRTGGNQRLSNFLLWQAAYSEFYFTETLWPDFDEKDMQEALDFYNSQKRNFGK